MVSKASDDLPDPLGPVITTSRSRGRVRLMFLRLCCRAPRTTSRSMGRARASTRMAPMDAVCPRLGAGAERETSEERDPWPMALDEPPAPVGQALFGVHERVQLRTKNVVTAMGAGSLLGAIALVGRYAPSQRSPPAGAGHPVAVQSGAPAGGPVASGAPAGGPS